MRILFNAVAAFWFGSGAFLLAVAAPAAFRGSPTPAAAADVVGAMLQRWHYIALASPLILLGIEWGRMRPRVVAVVFAAVLLASLQIVADLKIRSIRASSPVPVSELSRQDPVRRRFGMLHGASSALLLAQVIVAGLVAGRGASPPAP